MLVISVRHDESNRWKRKEKSKDKKKQSAGAS